MLGLSLDGALCFTTARQARKAADLARHPGCVLTVADTDVDLVVEGMARVVRDEERLRRDRLEWGWLADERKRAQGTQRIPLADIADVEWRPAVGMDYGHLRFRRRSDEAEAPPHLDPNCLLLWGTKKESGTSALVGAAVLGRLPHPAVPAPVPVAELPAPAPASEAEAGDPDVVLRRLRELGDLRSDGILDDAEFAAAKAALLRRL